ncbi:MAG: accessory gene regulator B family protein [Agathobacter sp.]|nr:accessory gene regulator B family protein [Agathobacter sp.]
MENICLTLVKKLVHLANLSKDEEDIEVYTYGLLTFLYTLIPLIVLLIIASFFGKVYEILSWTITFLCLRKHSGGYHAKTPRQCLLYSILLGTSSLLVCANLPLVSINFYFSSIIINYIILVFLTPTTNKNFTLEVQLQCKIKITILIIIFSIFYLFHPNLQPYHLYALFCTSLLCIAQKILKC